MKVLLINSVYKIRSTGKIIEELHEGLSKLGTNVYIAYAVGEASNNSYKIGNIIDRKIHALLSRTFGLQGYFSYFSTKNLLKYINFVKPNIIHLHNLHSNYINLPMLLKYVIKHNIGLVITLHDCWFFTGKCTHFSLTGCMKWQTGCMTCPRLKKDNPSWFFDRTKKMFNDKKNLFQNINKLGVIGVSNWISDQAKLSFFTDNANIKRIYNWIDDKMFFPRDIIQFKKNNKINDKFIILGVATFWTLEKGIYKFLELAQYYKNDLIILIGNVMKNIQLPNNVIHIEEIHNDETLSLYYSSADVFLNLSYEESFGKVTAESMACGTPAIVYNSTANPELIGENCGYVVEPFNTDYIIEKIDLIKKNGKKAYSHFCVEHVKKNFNKDRLILEHKYFYDSIF